MPTPKASDLFGDSNNPVEIATRFENYKAELNKSLAAPRPAPGQPGFEQPRESGVESLNKALGSADVSKALSPELVDSVRNALAQAEVGKAGSEWTTGNPVGTGLVAFDLEAPAKLLAPRPTPLRNRIARRKGIGLAHRFKRITGFTGTGTGGQGIFRPGITEGGTVAGGTQFSQGGWTPMRGAQITYAGDDQAVNYKQFSVSDSVSWAAQFSGQGYEDVRQLSQTTLLYSSMLLEERMLLGSRGTDSGFAGALSAPSISSVASGSAGAGQTSLSGVTTNIYIKVSAECVWGESVASTVFTPSPAITTGIATISATLPQGATGMKVYVGTGASAPGSNAGYFYAGRSGNGTFVLQGALPTTGSNPLSADNSATASEYDGILTYCTGPNAGAVNYVNGLLSKSNPGDEFNQVFATLYDNVKADPDEILANGHDRKQLSDTLKVGNGSSVGNSYRITLEGQDAHGAQIGSVVTGVQNEVTGKMVDITVHPWLPQGNMPIISWTLPLPDSNVSDVFACYDVQPYMGIQWPVNQFLYESSSYWYGTMVCYAPAWCGAVTGITQA